MKENCPFCHPEKFIRSHFEQYGVHPQLDKAPVMQTGNLIVVPDILPISDDFHFIVYTREDCQVSFASSPELQYEVGQALYTLEQTWGDLVFVEHGGFSNGSNSSSSVQTVAHRHAHILPATNRLVDFLSDVLTDMSIAHHRFVATDLSPINALTQFSDCQQNSYLLAQEVRQGAQGLIAFDQNNTWPSQITQKNISLLLNGDVLDWKQIPTNSELARLSVQRISAIVEKCQI